MAKRVDWFRVLVWVLMLIVGCAVLWLVLDLVNRAVS